MIIIGEKNLFEIWGSSGSRLIASVIVFSEDFSFFWAGLVEIVENKVVWGLEKFFEKVGWDCLKIVGGLRLDSFQFLWTIGVWGCWTASRLLTQSSGSSLRICLRNLLESAYLTLFKNVWGPRFLTSARGNASAVIPLDFLQGGFPWTIGWLNLRVAFWVSQDWEFNVAGMW